LCFFNFGFPLLLRVFYDTPPIPSASNKKTKTEIFPPMRTATALVLTPLFPQPCYTLEYFRCLYPSFGEFGCFSVSGPLFTPSSCAGFDRMRDRGLLGRPSFLSRCATVQTNSEPSIFILLLSFPSSPSSLFIPVVFFSSSGCSPFPLFRVYGGGYFFSFLGPKCSVFCLRGSLFGF